MAEKLTAPALAKELGVKPTALRAWLRAHGYQPTPGASYAFTSAEAKKIKAEYAKAAAPKEAAPAKKGKGRKASAPTPAPEDVPDDLPDDEGSQDPDDDDLELEDDVEELDMS